MAYAIIYANGNVEFEVGLPDIEQIQSICHEGFEKAFVEAIYISRPDTAMVWVNDSGLTNRVEAAGVNPIASRLTREDFGNTYIRGNAIVVGRDRGGRERSLSRAMQEHIIELTGGTS